jgi:DegV family protein with EDD domain
MVPILLSHSIMGVERLAAWSDLLDGINVFPVADGDTGRNLRMSLSPLRYPSKDRKNIIHKLLLSARGNSGNIAARFLSEFLMADSVALLPRAAESGRDRSWQAVCDPKPGTMLTVFDALVEFFQANKFEVNPEYVSTMVVHLEKAVKSTPELIPKLKRAGVVDSGALGMYLFLEGFFASLAGKTDHFRPITMVFEHMLKISSSFEEEIEEGFCVDTVVHLRDNVDGKIRRLSENCESMLVTAHDKFLKVHLHTNDTNFARHQIESLGTVVQWSDDHIGTQVEGFKQKHEQGAIHIMTDAAGSVTRKDSLELGMTLLDSYITAGDKSLPETLFSPSDIYGPMRGGLIVTTSQASTFERHQSYQRVLSQYPRVLYLCVGSAFTGNYDVAMDWKRKNDSGNCLTVIDTGAASGRLGAIVIATARYATKTHDPDAVIEFARKAVDDCEEYIFLDRLKYLARGGRASKSSAFLGDAFHVKPVISPTAQGAKILGTVRNKGGQLRFALKKLRDRLARDSTLLIMLEYSDNRDWVDGTVRKQIEALSPSSEVFLQPLSLTSGVHMGPGTWAVAFLPNRLS